MKKLLLVCFLFTMACSSSDSGGGSTTKACTPGETNACTCVAGGSGVQVCRDDGAGYGTCECATPTDSGPADTGPVCSGISGTYSCTRKRSTTSPGSCAPGYTFNPSMPVRIAADPGEASGYKVEIGYTNNMTGETDWTTCTNNVTKCQIFATCTLASATDQVTLTISGNSVTGTLARTDTGSSTCTINFTITGSRS